MEADWEFEIGGDAPVIDAAWSALVDLRIHPERIGEIGETADLPGLRDALLRLNAEHSPVWTAKCDVWQPEDFDADELDTDPLEGALALACYVDLLPRNPRLWAFPNTVQQCCEMWCSALQTIPLKNGRVDLVVRRAWTGPDEGTFGITAYITACGSDVSHARTALNAALETLATAIAPLATGADQDSHYNGENPGE